MKNKNLLIIGIIVAILLIGGGYFLTMNKTAVPAPQANQQNNSQVVNSNNTAQEIEGSIKSLLSGGSSVSCTFSNTAEETTVTGTVYAANGKVRQDFQSNSTAGNMTGHMIMDTKDAYMWTDQMDQGFKFSVSDQPSPAANTNSQTPDINKNMKFSCVPWSADNSLFEVPSNITFQTMNIPAIPAGNNEGATDGVNMSDQCAVCNNIPEGPGRDACKTQLKCQ